MCKSNKCFWVSLARHIGWEKLGDFRSKLHLRASNFSIWKLLFRQKNRVEGHGGYLENLVSGRLKPSSDQLKSKTPCDMAVIDTIQWVSMEKVDCLMLPRCSISPHLTVTVFPSTMLLEFVLVFWHQKWQNYCDKLILILDGTWTRHLSDSCLFAQSFSGFFLWQKDSIDKTWFFIIIFIITLYIINRNKQ